MKIPSYADTLQVLLLQAADEGRGEILFGESLERARKETPPFMIGRSFPSVYFEHPLIGDPFIDITVLLGEVERGARVDSRIAGDHGAMIDWYSKARSEDDKITCGFEIDTKDPTLPIAAIHFQPRANIGLVRPFCEVVGEPERADLYLNLAKRMPAGWPLSFFGMFRGRAASPLRVCGYLDGDEAHACSEDANRIAQAFDATGFTAYDDVMLTQITALMAAAPSTVDFQLDVFPDGSIGPTFAIDVQFGIEKPGVVFEMFESGPGASVMRLLQGFGAADKRWHAAIRSAFARALPIELESGELGRYSFILMPQWVKARWTNGVLQPSKLYHFAFGQVLGD